MSINRKFKLDNEMGSRGFSQKRSLIYADNIEIILDANFYNYLSTPVDILLKEYEQKEAWKKQLKLF